RATEQTSIVRLCCERLRRSSSGRPVGRWRDSGGKQVRPARQAGGQDQILGLTWPVPDTKKARRRRRAFESDACSFPTQPRLASVLPERAHLLLAPQNGPQPFRIHSPPIPLRLNRPAGSGLIATSTMLS